MIKRLAKRLAAQPSAVQDMFDEARIAATLSHANIVQVNDIEIADGQVSIVMEFLHGHDVSHLLRRMKRAGERVPLDQAVAIVLGVCAGLHHAHERVDSEGKSLDIVHRDVSPHNVFVTYDGAVKLVDFGIARASVRKGQTEHGFIKGKPGYIAPEQIKGRNTDRRTDVWGAAVLLYELTTGNSPYGTSTAFDDLVRVTKVDPPPPSTYVTDYPAELEAIVIKGMARDPAQRYATADAMRHALDEFARARGLDQSPFRMAALMERVFAENLEAWRQSQHLGKSLAEHVAAFKTSGAHSLVDLPGDPTEPFVNVGTLTTPLGTADFVAQPITAPTRLIKPKSIGAVPVTPPQPAAAKTDTEPTNVIDPTHVDPTHVDPTNVLDRTEHSAVDDLAPTAAVIRSDVRDDQATRPTPLAFESLTFSEMVTMSEQRRLAGRWRKPAAIALAVPLVLFVSLLAWGALDLNHSTTPMVPASETHATAGNEEPVAQPITVVPIEPAPAPAKPAATEEPSVETSA
ncbi:MAG TPA: serine/threonine-protein kinase, partial [Kofleriaceae bacterium]